MAVSTFVKNNTNGEIRVADANALGMTLQFDQGDFTVGPIMDILQEVVKYERRGKFKSLNLSSRVYPTGSFTACVTQFTDATVAMFMDFILGTGAFAARVGTLPGPKFACNITFKMEGTDFGDDDDHEFTLHDCIVTIDNFTEGDPNLLSFSFEVLGPITGDITASAPGLTP